MIKITNWLMQLDFVTRAVLVGMLIASIAGPLGSLLIWRRMAYFGDTLSHATLLGVGCAAILQVNLYIGLIGVCLLVAILLAQLTKNPQLANDTLLGLLSHTTLAVGLILATYKRSNVDVLGYLFGDILSINGLDLLMVGFVVIFLLLILYFAWPQLLSTTVHTGLAYTEGVAVTKIRWLFVLMLALLFAITIKLIGVLLITALLLIPAATARQIARTPESMAIMASIIGGCSVISGLQVSLYWDWPCGPAVVVVTAILFALSLIFAKSFSQ